MTNPEELSGVPADSIAYLRRYDANGVFVERYDLRDPNNYSIEWSVIQAQGTYATMELIIKDKCLAANIDGLGRVNFIDLAFLAEHWAENGASIIGDTDGDDKVNRNDLAIVVETWLFDCYPW